MKRTLEKELKEWKRSKRRYPLLLRGARQVGKTYLIEQFGKREFDSLVSVNFEAQPEVIACFASLDPQEILMRLQSILQQPIKPGKTLLFLDEIQACPNAIMSLRYFKEKLPELHVIGAGSLLEFSLIKGQFSFPVGRIQFMYLKPLSFSEYALARGKENELEEIKGCLVGAPPTEETHNIMIKLVKEYFLTGGMPAAVSSFCDHLSLKEMSQVHEILLSTYQADFSKYATVAEQKYLLEVFRGLFPLIAKQFKYAKIDPHIRSRELKLALDQLQWAGLVSLVHASSASGIPISAQVKQKKFKALFLDIGLVQHALKINPEVILDTDVVQINRGALAEQFVGQELLAYTDPYLSEQLHFWEREKQHSSAEVDYLYAFNEHIIPIEVKAGSQGRLRSMQLFMQEKKVPVGVQISQKPLAFENGILSLPFYAISELPRFIGEGL